MGRRAAEEYERFTDVCTIFCEAEAEEVRRLVEASAQRFGLSRRGPSKDGEWKKAVLFSQDAKMTINLSRYVGGGTSGARGKFNRVILGTTTFFQDVRKRKAQRDEAMHILDGANTILGCVGEPFFSDEHYALIFAVAAAGQGLVFDGEGLLDGAGRLVIDRSGRGDIQVFSVPSQSDADPRPKKTRT